MQIITMRKTIFTLALCALFIGLIGVRTRPAEAQRCRVPAATPTPMPGHRNWFISTAGTSTGAGTIGDPIDIDTARGPNSPLRGGDMGQIRGGTYRVTGEFASLGAGHFVFRVSGALGLPITFINYNGEHVILMQGIQTQAAPQGQYLTFQGLDLDNDDVDRTIQRPTGFTGQSPGGQLINCIVHNNGNGVFRNEGCIGCQAIGNVIYNNGWQGASPDRPHGAAIYTQNLTGTQGVIDNLVVDSWSNSNQIFGVDAGLRGIKEIGNIFAHTGRPVSYQDTSAANTNGSGNALDKITYTDNYTFVADGLINTNVIFGEPVGNGDLNCARNYFVHLGANGLNVSDWKRVTFQNNTIIAHDRMITITTTANSPLTSGTFSSNSYRETGSNTTPFVIDGPFGNGQSNFAAWQAFTGFDTIGSTFVSGAASGQIVKVRVNPVVSSRGHVIVYNFSAAATVTGVDLSSILKPNDPFDVYVVPTDGTYFGAAILHSTAYTGPVTLNIPGSAKFMPYVVIGPLS